MSMLKTNNAAASAEAAGTGALEIAALSHGFGLGAKRVEVIADCNLVLTPGKLTVMIGPSGCGKSTLAKLIAGYLPPDEGRIRIDGRHVTGPGKDRLMVFQESALFPWMVTEENALFGLRASGSADESGRERTMSLLDRVGLSRFAKKYPGALSGGMQRRLEMVRALVNDPALFILDEPFRGLDAMTRTLMQEHFAGMFEQGRRTALFITTDIDEALLLADQIVVMSHRPMRVTKVIPVDAPRPRTIADLFKNDRINEVKAEVMEVLYAEAMKAFKGSSRIAGHAQSSRPQFADSSR